MYPLYLKNHWVTLHPWVCHLKCSLYLLALPKESLGYIEPMGVQPKVQQLTNIGCTLGSTTMGAV